VLLKDQSAGAQNGVYVFNGASSTMTRATDVNVSAEITANTMVPIDAGTASAGRVFRLATANVAIGTTAQSWEQAGTDLGSLTVTGATGLTGNLVQSGGTVSLSSNGAATVNAAGNISVNSSANLTLETNSNTHPIKLGAENKNGPINIGTAGTRTISVGSGSATEIDLTATTIDVNGDVAIAGATGLTGNLTQSGGTVSLSSNGALSVSSAGNASVTSAAGLMLETDSNTHTISLGAENKNGPISIGTAGTRTISVGSGSATEIDLTATTIDVNGAVDISGAFTPAYLTTIPFAAETKGNGSYAASTTIPATFVSTASGTAAISLADGGSYPMRKLFYLSATDAGAGAGNACVITPDNLGGYSTITLDTAADRIELLWTTNNWVIWGGYGYALA